MTSDRADAGMDWGECWLEPGPIPPALASEVRQRVGAVPAWAPRLSRVPWVVRSFARVVGTELAYMPPALWGRIGLVVARENSCRYCYGMTRVLLKLVGHSDDAIDRLERDVHVADVSAADRAALAFARRVSQANPPPNAADVAELVRAGFSRPAIGEIIYASAFAGYPNRVATLFAIPPERFERWIDHPLARLVRPLIARQFRRKMKLRPEVPSPDPNTGPCANVVAALAGSPAAHVVRESVDEALASPILPRRTKLLMLAVIGRALDSGFAEAEARERLASEGLAATEVDDVVMSLGSAALDDRDRLLLPFARETVRYRSTAIQERTRELSARLPIEEVIEAAGVAALANAVARMAVLLETC